MNQKDYKITGLEGVLTNSDNNISTPYFLDRLNHARQLHKALHALVKEMAPVALISRSEAYQQAEALLTKLGDPAK